MVSNGIMILTDKELSDYIRRQQERMLACDRATEQYSNIKYNLDMALEERRRRRAG